MLSSLVVCASAPPRLHTLTSTPSHLLRAPPSSKLGPPPRYVTQPRDHFDASDTKTWQQAYYVNDTFFVPGSNAPVFLCVGGEGPPLDGSVVVASVHCNVAVEWLPATGALMLAVEHRYYGCHNASACPYSAADPQPLKWLSSRQALADLATFHAHATAAFGLTAQNKWVSWGGSYPGMLAGWFRVTYPNLVHAAVASSAPVIAKLDMQEYNDVTAEAYALPSVGGSDACRANIADGHATIGAMLNTSSGRDALAKTFRLPSGRWLKSRANQRGFAGFGVANFPAQSNDPACTAPLCNIAKICEVMAANDTKTNVERLAVLRNGGAGARAAAARAAEASAVEEEAASAARSPHETLDYWGYQTCTEFGFYQTCEDGTECFYTQGLDLLEDNDDFCQNWGIAPTDIQASIDATNQYYGAGRPNATRILYPNGDVDPWHGLSILTAPSPELPVMMVSGASHHAWTHPTLPTDQPSVVAARGAIRKQVAAWLAAP